MRQGPHPIRFFVLLMPFSAAYSFAAVALQYVATKRFGIPVKDYAAVISAAFLVHFFKVLWAPVVDGFLSKRLWYVIGFALAVGGVMASSLVPIGMSTLKLIMLVVMASQIGLTLMGFACENFLAELPENEKGRASGYYQAGNFVGLGLGGTLALELTDRLPHLWMTAGALCVAITPCLLALIGMPEPPRAPSVWRALVNLGRDFIALIVVIRDGRVWFTAIGITGMLIAVSPVGAGAAGNFWPSLGDAWGASEHVIAEVNGWLGGLAGGLGAALGGWVADRMNRRLAYALGGACTALTAVLMAIGPRTWWAFAAGALVYSVFNGAVYACFSAFVLETIGKGAAATKYNIFAALSNLAISYMTTVDARALDRWNTRGLLFVDAGATTAGIFLVVLVVFAFWVFRRATQSQALSST